MVITFKKEVPKYDKVHNLKSYSRNMGIAGLAIVLKHL